MVKAHVKNITEDEKNTKIAEQPGGSFYMLSKIVVSYRKRNNISSLLLRVYPWPCNTDFKSVGFLLTQTV